MKTRPGPRAHRGTGECSGTADRRLGNPDPVAATTETFLSGVKEESAMRPVMEPQTLNDIFFAIVERNQERVMLAREADQWAAISSQEFYRNVAGGGPAPHPPPGVQGGCG